MTDTTPPSFIIPEGFQVTLIPLTGTLAPADVAAWLRAQDPDELAAEALGRGTVGESAVKPMLEILAERMETI